MPANPFPDSVPRGAPRSSRRPSPLIALVVALVALAGCATQRTPSNYDSSVRNNFIESCKGNKPDQQNEVKAPADTCTCAYDKIHAKIDFKRFKQINDKLSEKPGPLPADVQTLVDSCSKGA